jgi:hypothetical protein
LLKGKIRESTKLNVAMKGKTVFFKLIGPLMLPDDDAEHEDISENTAIEIKGM